MQGPSTAVIRSGAAPSPTIAATTRFQHAAEGTLPAGMRRADHARFRVGQQDRAAVGGEHAEEQARPIGHQRVGFGCAPRCPKARPRPAP